MIVPMEKISLILPASDAMKALETLRDFGMMHIQSVALPEKADRAALEVQCEELDRIIEQLSSIADAPGIFSINWADKSPIRTAGGISLRVDAKLPPKINERPPRTLLSGYSRKYCATTDAEPRK